MPSDFGVYARNHRMPEYGPYQTMYGQPGIEDYGRPAVPVRYPIYERLTNPTPSIQSRASHLPHASYGGGQIRREATREQEPYHEDGLTYMYGHAYVSEFCRYADPKQPPKVPEPPQKPAAYYTRSKL